MPLALLVLGMQACGGSAPKADSPGAPGFAAPGFGAPEAEQAATVDEALLALDRAEQRLSSMLGGAPAEAGSSGPPWAEPPQQPVGPLGPGSEPRPAPAPPLGERPAPQGAYGAADRCATACQAFASMQRAAGRLCGLAGEDDPRCERAMARVARAAELVRNACPECVQ
jgi:hypothetical protein